MPGDYQSASDRAEVNLDRTPEYPEPPKKGRSGGLGEFAASPAMMALQGISNIEKGMQAIVAVVGQNPQTAPLIQGLGVILTQLRQAVPQALTGGQSQFSPSGILTPPGMAMGAPPGIGAQGGAPNAPTPLPMMQQ